MPFEEHGLAVSSRDWDVGATFLVDGTVELLCPDCYRFGSNYEENGLAGASRFMVNYQIDPLQLILDGLSSIHGFGFEKFDMLRRRVTLEFKGFRSTDRSSPSRFMIYDYERIFDLEVKDIEYRGWAVNLKFDYDLRPMISYTTRIGEATEEAKSRLEFIRPSDIEYQRRAVKQMHAEVVSLARCFASALQQSPYLCPDVEVLLERYRVEYLNLNPR